MIIVVLVLREWSKFLASRTIPKSKQKSKFCSSRKTFLVYRRCDSSRLYQQECSVFRLYESGKFPSVKKWLQEVPLQSKHSENAIDLSMRSETMAGSW
jgi:hypothetical protein